MKADRKQIFNKIESHQRCETQNETTDMHIDAILSHSRLLYVKHANLICIFYSIRRQFNRALELMMIIKI